MSAEDSCTVWWL